MQTIAQRMEIFYSDVMPPLELMVLLYTVYCYSYKILKETPKGCWIMNGWSAGESFASNMNFKKFVLNSGRKRFAHETRREAIESFLARKRRQYEIIVASLDKCTASYVAAGGTLPITIRTYHYSDADY